MTTLKQLLLTTGLACLLATSGCGGGGGNSGTTGFGGGTTPTPSASVAGLIVTLSTPSVPNTGASTATATVTAIDANNNTVSGAPVTLAANAGGVVTIQGTLGSVTDSTGRLTATVGIGSNFSNRAITLTASAGSITGTATLNVVASAAGAVPASIDLIASATTVGTGGDGVLISAFVKDANNNALPSAAVTFKASTGTLSAVAAATNASGLATATIAAGADRSNRTVTITVAAGTITNQITLPVTGTTLALQGPTSLILGNSAIFGVTASDSKGNVIPGVTITATSSLGNPLAAVSGTTTNSSGLVQFNYTASKGGTDSIAFSGAGTTVSPVLPLTVSSLNFAFVSPAPATIVPVNVAQSVKVQLLIGGAAPAATPVTFAATGGTLSSNTATTDGTGSAQVSFSSASAGPVTVQATVNIGGTLTSTTLPLTVVGTVPSNLVLQVSPTALPPNPAGSTANQAQVLAKVTDAAGNPVQGATVNFTRVADPSGGNLQQVSAVTDASGKATVTYVSGAQSTSNNGVVLQAAVASAPAVSGQATLTVNQAALFIALGTGNTITNIDPQTYKKDWVVYVTDSNGIAVNAVTLTVKAIPTQYLTGRLVWNAVDTLWEYSSPIYACRNEDANQNGILDPGEDDNGDGVLEPGNVVAVTPSTVQTANGQATISLVYAESYVPWIVLQLTASATVAGTESKTSATFTITGLASDFNQQTNPPAGVNSPFGAVPTAAALAKGVCTKLQ